MPMPLDLLIVYNDNSRRYFNIPLRIMRGHKPLEEGGILYTILEDWPWTNPTYEFVLDVSPNEIREIVIDPEGRLADVNRENNVLVKP